MTERFEHTCSHCRYFVTAESQNGNCHRFPPVYAGDSSPREIHHWRFPSVHMHAWCGEFLPDRSDQMSSSGATI
jgi:hypothetical protein